MKETQGKVIMMKENKSNENKKEGEIRTTLRYNKKIDRRLKKLMKQGHWQNLSDLLRDAIWHGLDNIEDEFFVER